MKEAVTNANINVSTGFIHFFVRIIFLIPAILVFTLMNKAPVAPPITPRIMDPGRVYKAFTS